MIWVAGGTLAPFAAFCVWLLWTTGQIRQQLEASVGGVSAVLEVRAALDAAQPPRAWTEEEIQSARARLGVARSSAEIAGAPASVLEEVDRVDAAVEALRGAPAGELSQRRRGAFAAMDRAVAALRARSRELSVHLGARWDFLNVVAAGALLLSMSQLVLLAIAQRQRLRAEAHQAELDAHLTTLRAVAERWATGDLSAPLPARSAAPGAFERALDDLRGKLLAKIEEIRRKTRTIEELDGELRHQLHERSLALAIDLSFHAIREAREPRRGDVLAGRYTVEERVGAGGMGDVWRVRRGSDDRLLALKVLRRVGDERHRLRFLREAALLARVRHPNVVSIFDLGVSPGGVPYLVTEIVEGARLDEVAQTCAIDAHLARLRAVADGLAAIHAAGVVHRDLKPANILVAPEPGGSGAVKIIDFGIARLAAEGHETPPDGLGRPSGSPTAQPEFDTGDDTLRALEATEEGAILGTPHYIAPELAAGQPPTPAADIFAFGVTSYRILTGSLPPSVARCPPPAIDARCKDLPPRAASLVMACLSPDPAERPSARDLAAGL